MAKNPVRARKPIMWVCSDGQCRETGMRGSASTMWWAFRMSNLVPKHYRGSPCEVCGEELTYANSWLASSPICDGCRKKTSKKELEKKWAQIRRREDMDKEGVQILNTGNVPLVLKKEKVPNRWDKVVWILGVIFALWFISAIISSRGDSSKIYIDCRQSSWQNSPYCDGTFENEIRDQEGIENSYYQNIVR